MTDILSGTYIGTATAEPSFRFSPSDAGCWYDSHRGYEGIAREVISDAIKLGMVTEFDLDADTEEDDSLLTDEGIHWAEEQATDFLSNLAPEGFWIGWQDGDFGMYAIEEED